jgi:hypothetical protein
VKEQLTILNLASRRYWSAFSAVLTPLVERCLDLADTYSPGLKDQWTEGLVNGWEFINRLIDDMTPIAHTQPCPITIYAALEILDRADGCCRKFATQSEALAMSLCPVEWNNFQMGNLSAYLLCCKLAESINTHPAQQPNT